jgi:hypothetical protein
MPPPDRWRRSSATGQNCKSNRVRRRKPLGLASCFGNPSSLWRQWCADEILAHAWANVLSVEPAAFPPGGFAEWSRRLLTPYPWRGGVFKWQPATERLSRGLRNSRLWARGLSNSPVFEPKSPQFVRPVSESEFDGKPTIAAVPVDAVPGAANRPRLAQSAPLPGSTRIAPPRGAD